MNKTTLERSTFLVCPLGWRQIALPATDVAELSHNGIMQSFPHRSEEMLGVLVRRGEILPIWDLAGTLDGCGTTDLKYWLVTRRNFAAEEATAIPVSGECEMLRSEMQAPPEDSPAYVRGIVMWEDGPVEVLDLSRLSRAGKKENI